MAIKGWLKLHRTFLEWEWYKDNNTKAVYLHLLLNACIEPCVVYNTLLSAGQYITTIATLALECNITTKQCRTAVNHLIATGNITVTTTNKFSVFTVLNFAKYQGQAKGQTKGQTKTAQEGKQKPLEGANNFYYDTPLPEPNSITLHDSGGQTKITTEGKQKSSERANKRASKRASIEEEVLRNIKNNNIYNNSCCSSYNIYIPTQEEITDYIHNNNYDYDPEYFYNYYKARNWCIGNTPIQDFNALTAIMDNWQKRERNKKNPAQPETVPQPKGVFNNYNQKTYTAEEIEQIIKRKQGGT